MSNLLPPPALDCPRTEAAWKLCELIVDEGKVKGFDAVALYTVSAALERELAEAKDKMLRAMEDRNDELKLRQAAERSLSDLRDDMVTLAKIRQGADSPYVQAPAEDDQTSTAPPNKVGASPCEPEPTHVAQSAPATISPPSRDDGFQRGLRAARAICLEEMVDGNVSAEDEAYNTAIRHCIDSIEDAMDAEPPSQGTSEVERLRQALYDTAERLADAAQVMREQPTYYNPEYYERTAWRCWHVLVRGGSYHDASYDDPPAPRPKSASPQQDSSK